MRNTDTVGRSGIDRTGTGLVRSVSADVAKVAEDIRLRVYSSAADREDEQPQTLERAWGLPIIPVRCRAPSPSSTSLRKRTHRFR